MIGPAPYPGPEASLLRPGSETFWPLPQDPTAARRARQITRRQLLSWELNEPCDTAELLVSELVTNALSHGRGPVRLCLAAWHGTLRCEVADQGGALPRRRPLSLGGETGRGMHLVDVLADRWGVDLRGPGKTVWFELPTCTDARCCPLPRPHPHS